MKTRWLLAVVSFAICIVGSISQTHADITTGLVAYYPFEGNANDASGNGNNGTTYSTILTNNQLGQPNSAYYFNGTSSRIFIADSTIFQIVSNLTLEAFIFAESPLDTYYQNQIVFRGDDRGGFDPYVLQLDGGTNLGFWITGQGNNVAAVQKPISLGSWHQVAGTFDAALGIMNLYVDGVLVASNATSIIPVALLTGTNPGLGIGDVESTSYAEHFHGIISNVRIYNRTLSPSDVAELYAVDSSPCGGCVGPQGPAGPQGIQGLTGAAGVQGLKGDKGDAGVQGIQGLTGATGPQGLKGDKGDTGDVGPQGAEGAGVVQGMFVTLPTNSIPPDGYTLLGTTVVQYKYKVGKATKVVNKTLNLFQKD